MGWLISCRQAYIEGVDVHYSTNTRRLRHTMLMRKLPELLLPQRLSSVTSLDMIWDLYLFNDIQDIRPPPPDSGLVAYHELLEMLPATFPRLRRLFISLQGSMGPPYLAVYCSVGDPEHYKQCDSLVVQPLENMLRKLGPDMEECHIAAETALYVPVKRNDTGRGLQDWQVPDSTNLDRIWRELLEIGRPVGERDLKQQVAKRLTGYWLCHGKHSYGGAAYRQI